MFASVKSNDMTSFKAWLDAGGDGIDKEVNAIQYGYGVSPVVYRAGKGDEKPVRLVPNAMTEAMSGGASSAATVSMDSMGTSVFNEMIDDQSLLDSQYDVVAGHWPTSANEAVMVLSSRGTVGDYTLYSIGALDIDELNDLVNSAMTADGKVETPKAGTDFTYDDALSTTFKVLSPSDAYRKTKRPACGLTCLAMPTLWRPRLPTVLTCALWAWCDPTRRQTRAHCPRALPIRMR